MKKTLVALAALAATSAFSQSVSLYGALDYGYSSVEYTLAGASVAKRTGYGVGAHDTSRWGMTGSDDLGGGWKAEFKIENQIGQHPRAGFGGSTISTAGAASLADISYTNGTPEKGNGYTLDATVIGNRELWTAVSNANGTRFQVGYGTTALRNLAVETDAAGSNQFGNQIAHIVGAFRRFGARVDQGFGPVTVSLGSFGNQATTNNTQDVRVNKGYTANVRYANGPIVAGLGYDSARSTTGSTIPYNNANTGFVLTGTNASGNLSAADNTVKTTMIGGSYDFGVAKAYGQYFKQTIVQEGAASNAAKTGDFKGTSIGVRVPVGAFVPFAQYYSGKNTVRLVAGADEDRSVKGPSVGVRYNLSKRTYAYLNTGSLKTAASSVAGGSVGEIKFKQTSAGLVAYF